LAAGAGERLGAGRPKALVEIDGRPLVSLAAETVAGIDGIDALVIAAPTGSEARTAELLPELGMSVSIVPGGPTRQASVAAALASIPAEVETIVCHDAARALASPRLFAAVLAALSLAGPSVVGVVPVVPVTDTIKRVAAGRVVGTPPRDELVAAQTPQAFRAAALREAHERAARSGTTFTDDAAAIEAAGGTVLVVPGEPGNLKITDTEDLVRAERLRTELARG
jgi:2-C-methyl-D-erythritol 4-phosphate cytidylyltransferase